MDATLVWTVVGSVAGVAGVAAAVAIAVIQARLGRRHPAVGLGDRIRVVVEPPSSSNATGAGVTALRAPTGRLPERVRGRDELLARPVQAGRGAGWADACAGGHGRYGQEHGRAAVAEEITRLGGRAGG